MNLVAYYGEQCSENIQHDSYPAIMSQYEPKDDFFLKNKIMTLIQM